MDPTLKAVLPILLFIPAIVIINWLLQKKLIYSVKQALYFGTLVAVLIGLASGIYVFGLTENALLFGGVLAPLWVTVFVINASKI